MSKLDKQRMDDVLKICRFSLRLRVATDRVFCGEREGKAKERERSLQKGKAATQTSALERDGSRAAVGVG